MTILLVRHGSAGDPYRWSGDDVDRPLDATGTTQAIRLDGAVAEMGLQVVRLLSSRATRCLQTVGPLGERHGVPAEVEDDLFEGAGVHAKARVAHCTADFLGQRVQWVGWEVPWCVDKQTDLGRGGAVV